MKKIIAIIAFVGIAAGVLSARVVRNKLDILQGSVPETEIIAPETMEFVYDYRYCVDTTDALKDNYEGRLVLTGSPSSRASRILR